MARFPGVKIICTHRDTQEVVGSLISMAWSAAVRDCDELDPMEYGSHWFEQAKRLLFTGMNSRLSDPASSSTYRDVKYVDLVKDPLGTARNIYTFLNTELSPDVEKRMRAWIEKDRPKNSPGAHKYKLESFGVSPEQVEQQTRQYTERFLQ